MRTLSTSPLVLFAVLAVALLAIWRPTAVTAALPPRPTLTPTPAPTPTPLPVPPPARQNGVGAHIVLQAVGAPSNAWTVVQWQGGDGAWHDVEGWKGHVRDSQVRWRVAPKDFGTGPFRWLVYDAPGGPLIAVSNSFTLPGSAYHLVTVTVTPVAGE